MSFDTRQGKYRRKLMRSAEWANDKFCNIQVTDKKYQVMFTNKCREKWGSDIDINYFYFNDYIMLLYQVQYDCKTNVERLDYLESHLYNPFVLEMIKVKYSPLNQNFFSPWRFRKPSHLMIEPKRFNPHYFDIIDKYNSGKADIYETYLSLANFYQFYRSKYGMVIVSMFGFHKLFDIDIYKMRERFGYDVIHPLPERQFREIPKTTELDYSNFFLFNRPAGRHAYVIFDEFGTSSILLADDYGSFKHINRCSEKKLTYDLSYLNLRGVVMEGFFCIKDKTTGRLLSYKTKQVTDNSKYKSKFRDNPNYSAHFYAFDIFTREELIKNEVKENYMKRNESLHNIFDGIPSFDGVKVCECVKLNGKDHYDAIVKTTCQLKDPEWNGVILMEDKKYSNYNDLYQRYYIPINKRKK